MTFHLHYPNSLWHKFDRENRTKISLSVIPPLFVEIMCPCDLFPYSEMGHRCIILRSLHFFAILQHRRTKPDRSLSRMRKINDSERSCSLAIRIHSHKIVSIDFVNDVSRQLGSYYRIIVNSCTEKEKQSNEGFDNCRIIQSFFWLHICIITSSRK